MSASFAPKDGLAAVKAAVAGMPRARRLLAGALLIVLVGVVWFASIPHGILIGDDVVLVSQVKHGEYASTIPQALTGASQDRYRPVLAVVFSFIVPLFGTHFGAYEAFNLLIEIGSALLVAAVVLRLTRGSEPLALASAVAFLVSRFAYYNVMQVDGLMEGLALFFMMLALRDAADAFALDRYERLKRTVLWYALALYTDERFVVLGLFVVTCALAHPRARAQVRTLGFVVIGAVAVVLSEIFLKAFVFHQHVLIGAGGRPGAIDLGQILGFLTAALANVLGFNVGPNYLSAKDVAETGPFGYLLGFLVAVPALAVLGAYAAAAVRERRPGAVRAAAIGLALFVPLLLTTAVTFRQEFRWLYAADAVFLIGVAVAAVRAEPRRVMTATALVAIVASAAGAVWYRGFLDNVYFMSSMGIASGVTDAIARDPVDPIIVVDHGNEAIPNWVFLQGGFFALYGIEKPPVTFVNEVAQIRGAPASANILDVRGATVVPLTDPAKLAKPGAAAAAGAPAAAAASAPAAVAAGAVPPGPPVVPFPKTTRSFTAVFDRGTINDARPIATPSGRGALLFTWPGPSGPVSSLTVVATFRYRYPPVRIQRRMALAFYAGRPYAVGTPTRALVTATDRGKDVVIYDELLPLPGTAIDWHRHVIDLSRFAGRDVAFSFGAEASKGDPSASWAAFGFPALVFDAR
jgi:hypothetical protein